MKTVEALLSETPGVAWTADALVSELTPAPETAEDVLKLPEKIRKVILERQQQTLQAATLDAVQGQLVELARSGRVRYLGKREFMALPPEQRRGDASSGSPVGPVRGGYLLIEIGLPL